MGILIKFFIINFIFLNFSNAEIVQILHTNDTHSYLDHATHNPDRGGSGRLKVIIDQYKKEMSDQNIKTIVMDGGDFLEGNLYFMADRGRKSFEVYNSIGYDFGVLGNHDYQMGIKELDGLFRDVTPRHTLLTANIDISSKYAHFRKYIKPYHEFKIGDARVAILGLTTDELFYKWLFPKDSITDPIDTAQKYEQILKDRGNNFIIALTHIGLSTDKKLASKTKYIDLIVGGHSHTEMRRAVRIENKREKLVPIVQAGQHTDYIGRLMVDITKGKSLKIISYELIPTFTEGPKDEKIESIIEAANEDLNNLYGREWLDESIGFSDLEKDDVNGKKKWAYFITDTLKEATGSQVAIHSPDMNGDNFPIGPITRRMILNSMPRVFDFNEKFGWDIYTVNVRGAWLNYFIRVLSFVGDPLALSGVSADVEYTNKGRGITSDIRINGKRINPVKNYKVAFSEGIIKGAKGVTEKTLKILKNPTKSGTKIWQALEDILSKQNKSIKIIDDENRTMIDHHSSNQ